LESDSSDASSDVNETVIPVLESPTERLEKSISSPDEVPKKPQSSVRKSIADVVREFKNPEMIKLMPTLILTGLMQGVPTASLYRMVTHSLPSDKYTNAEINKRIALTLGIYAASGICTGRVLTFLLPKGRNRNFIYFLNTVFIINTFYLIFIYYHPHLYLVFSVRLKCL